MPGAYYAALNFFRAGSSVKLIFLILHMLSRASRRSLITVPYFTGLPVTSSWGSRFFANICKTIHVYSCIYIYICICVYIQMYLPMQVSKCVHTSLHLCDPVCVKFCAMFVYVESEGSYMYNSAPIPGDRSLSRATFSGHPSFCFQPSSG